MTTPVTGIDSPRGDVLKYCILLRGSSAKFFSEAITNVRNYTERGDQIFAPDFPSFTSHDSKPITSKIDHGIYVNPDDAMDGPILPSEAVAATILFTECRAMISSSLDYHKKEAVLGITSKDAEDALERIVEGIAKFGNTLNSVAWLRKVLQENKSKDRRSKKKDLRITSLMEVYEKSLIQDGMKIGVNTTMAIVESIRKQMELQIRLDAHLYRDPKYKIYDPINSYEARGALIASRLFLEASELASSQFPNNG